MQKKIVLLLILIGSMYWLIAAPVSAQDENAEEQTPPFFSLSYTPVYISQTDLDSGGGFDVNYHILSLSIKQPVNRRLSVGLGLTYNYEDWNFDDPYRVAGATPWGAVHRPTLSLPITYSYSRAWTFGFTPSCGYAGESGAQLDESLLYGATVFLVHPFDNHLVLGFGAGLYSQLEETQFFPFMIVNWRINEWFRIANPFEAGPSGPAGLEFIYTPTQNWEVGIGGAYRSYRFRLEEDSAVSNGIAENEFLLGFLRVQRRLTEHLKLDLVCGALFEGKLTIENSHGGHVASDAYDPAPVFAATFSGQF